MNQRQLELQRDLYRLLLDVKDSPPETESILSKALGLIVQITGARIGYIELQNSEGNTWWSTRHCGDDEIRTIRQRISTGIIAEAISTGETIITPSAFLDPRFQNRESVTAQHIEAVLCSPFKSEDIKGVVYLQGDNGSELDDSHCMMEAELFAKHITPLLRHLHRQVTVRSPKEDLFEKYDLSDVIVKSPVFMEKMHEAMAIAELDVTVLLTGETGTGKGVLAQAIHKNSLRKYKPFVHLNCANLPEQLAESELFGAMRGAHSGAYTDVKGKISAAKGGTLFLDEIGVLPLPVQAKLLQFLEAGIYYPLGSQNSIDADVRIIAAANIDFPSAISKGTFREDLFYRLCVFPIRLPALKERKDDIAPLVRFFIDKYCKRFKMPSLAIAPSVLESLKESEWCGNVRQLENKVQQGILRARTDQSPTLTFIHLLPEMHTDTVVIGETVTYRESKDDWECRFIMQSLEKHSWNISETAKALGLSRSHLNNLVKFHKLERSNKKEINA